MPRAKNKSKSKTKSVKKSTKISKPKLQKQPKTFKNPRRAKTPSKKAHRTPVQRRFYTVGQDAIVIQRLQSMKKDDTQTQLAKELSVEFGRSVESIRDRMKRYIKKLSPADQKEVLKEAKSNPGYFVHFKAMGEVYRKIDKICDKEPTITSIQ